MFNLFGLKIEKRISIDGIVMLLAIVGAIMSYARLEAKEEQHDSQIATLASHIEKIDIALEQNAENEKVLSAIVDERTKRTREQ